LCQGVIVSLVKFQTESGKNKRIVLKGIGSHSDLLKDNQARLEKLGFKETCMNQDVISIESDFSGWNRFTVESGYPTRSEFAILTRAYKECAGNAKTLIAHVKFYRNIDDGLLNLLTITAWKAYQEAKAPASKAYREVEAPAWKAYQEVEATAWKAYQEAKAPAWKAYREVEAPALKAYREVEAPAWKAYQEAKATASKAYREVEAPALKAYQEAKATAWIKIFKKKENRVERLR
jgi:hypothetical protein